jgi:chemotaxis protein MotB
MSLMRGLLLWSVWATSGCIHLLKEEQRQVIEQLDSEVLALRTQNARLAEEVETCDQSQGPNEVYAELRQLLGATELTLSSDAQDTQVLIPGGLLFSRNSTKVRQEVAMELDLLAAVLRKHREHSVQITAHLDGTILSSSVRRSYGNHWALGSAQSTALMFEFVEKYDLDAARFTVSSRGAVQPLGDDDFSELRFPDWRVVLHISPPVDEVGNP